MTRSRRILELCMPVKTSSPAVLGILLVFTILSASLGVAAEKPNFIVFLADDLGYGDIGAFRELYPGSDDKPEAFRHTPNLNRLARAGIRCIRFYATGWCAPSRQALLSGQWVGRSRAYDFPWIGAQLRGEGYVTGIFGKSHGARPTWKVYEDTNPSTAEFDDGFFFTGGARDFYLKAGETFPRREGLKSSSFTAQGGEHLTNVLTDHAIDFIHQNTEKPFFLYLPYTAPHDPLQGKPEDLRELFPETFERMTDAEIRATSKQREDKHLRDCHYAALVYGVDQSVGRIMQTLQQIGIARNTIVIFTSDNGAQHGSNYPLTGHKWDGLEGGIRVPCIVWSQAIADSDRAGAVYDGLASVVDIAPTLWAQASAEMTPFPSDGINLLPFLLAQKPQPQQRRYFITNACYTFQNTGVDAFGFAFDKNQQLMQYVYIKDDEKILCWNPQGTTTVGAVHATLPNAIGQPDAFELLKETTPEAGVTPVSPAGIALFDEFIELIRTDGDKIHPTWSGATDREKSNYNWWLIDSDSRQSNEATK